MFRYEVQSRLEELARQPDDWFSLGENGDGSFAVRDSAGATADVTVGEQWVEVAARRPLDLGARAVAGGAGTGTLVRVTLAGSGPAGLLIAGRVYLDGFSMQALFLTVRDVLALAGPAPAAAPASGFTASPRLRVDDTPAAEETPASVAIATEGTAGTGAATNAEGPARRSTRSRRKSRWSPRRCSSKSRRR